NLHRGRHVVRQSVSTVSPTGAASSRSLFGRNSADFHPSRRAGTDRLHRHDLRQASGKHRADERGPTITRRRRHENPELGQHAQRSGIAGGAPTSADQQLERGQIGWGGSIAEVVWLSELWTDKNPLSDHLSGSARTACSFL